MKDIECPYCGHEQEEPDDCYEPNTNYEVECNKCEKVFHARCEYTRYWDTSPTPCLNDGKHDWKPLRGIGMPDEYYAERRRCSYCDDVKELKDIKD